MIIPTELRKSQGISQEDQVPYLSRLLEGSYKLIILIIGHFPQIRGK